MNIYLELISYSICIGLGFFILRNLITYICRQFGLELNKKYRKSVESEEVKDGNA